MALFEYAQAADTGGMFLGIGCLIFLGALTYWIYQMARPLKQEADLDEKYCLMEEKALEEFATKKGWNLKEMSEERNLWKRKTFKKQLHKKIMNKYFEKIEGDN